MADLPALLSGNIVGITLRQMDSLSANMIDCDAVIEQRDLYHDQLDTALIEVEKRDTAISIATQLATMQDLEIKNQKWMVDQQDQYITIVEKKLKRSKAGKILAWITGGIATGIMTGLYISK